MTSRTGAYRADIDGLRAIAVLSVVLFHAGVPGLGGGYVGVDVFFVISGYLITKGLLIDASIGGFYQRRARRILPALFVMLAITLAAGAVILLPNDLSALAKSAIATVGFVSNIWFWTTSGYFQTDSELMPLLHTWSLGVEEQFYIAFPIVIRLARNLSRRRLVILFALLFAASLALAVGAMAMNASSTAFYHSPMRAWELLAGSILASGIVPAIERRSLRTALALAGLALIAFPIFVYVKATPFPGLTALPPVLGSVALIAAGSGGRHGLSPLLEARPVVFVGLISYSLYLWHWPVLALSHYYYVRPLDGVQAASAVAIALVAATLSWRFVERPFRKGFSNRAIWVLSGSGIGAVASISIAVVALQGIPQRWPAPVIALAENAGANWRCPLSQLVPFAGSTACGLDLPSREPRDAQVILWGDSHAQMYAPAVMAATHGRPTLLVWAYGCAPTIDHARSRRCEPLQSANYRALRELPAKTVILAESWQQYRDELSYGDMAGASEENRYKPAIARLIHTVRTLRAEGKQVVIVEPIVRPNFEVADILARDFAFRGSTPYPTETLQADYDAEFVNVRSAIDELTRDPGVRAVDPQSAACFYGHCPYVIGGRAIFADYGHFAADFSASLGPLFEQALKF